MAQPMELWSRPAPPAVWTPALLSRQGSSAVSHAENRQPTTLLERDVLRALGEVVLNERHWWRDRHDNAAWKKKKTDIAVRVTRATLQDAAAHVVNWMAPAAKTIAETVALEELKLSLLLDHWPTASEAACLGQLPPLSRPSFFPTSNAGLSDRYLVFAWVLLRGICKRDGVAWPTGWGQRTCSCWSLRSLVETIAERGVHTLETLIRQREDGFDVLPEDVERILEDEDANTTHWLAATLFESIVSIRIDMKMTEMWTTKHLLSLLNDLELAHSAEDGVVVVPAPFPNAFIADDGSLTHAREIFTGGNMSPAVVEFKTPPGGGGETRTSSSGEKTLESLLSSLFPAFLKTHAAESRPPSSIVSHFVGSPERPALVVGGHANGERLLLSQGSWRPSLVIIDVETISIPARCTGEFPGDWRHNVSLPVNASVEIDATAVICIDATNVSVPDLQIGSLLTQDGEPLASPSPELYVRSSMTPNCSETNAGIVNVSAYPSRAIVLPRATRYRVANTTLVDPTQPGTVVLLRIALVTPMWNTPPSATIEAMLQESADTPEWLEDLQLEPHEKSPSVEEARFAHYNHDSKAVQTAIPVVFKSPAVAQSLPISPPVRPEMHPLEQETLNRITMFTNAPQWWESRWVEGSASRRGWEQEMESFYLHKHLQSQVAKAYASVVATLAPKAANPFESVEDEDEDDNSANSFVGIAKLFARIVMLRKVHHGFASSDKSDQGKTSAKVVVDLVQQCLSATSQEARARILSDFMGVGYPVTSLLAPLASVWEQFNHEVKAWMKRVTDVVDGQRLALLQELRPGLYSPAEGTCVLDGAVAQVVKAGLVAALEPFLCEALSGKTDRVDVHLVHPMSNVVSMQIASTFSVPRAGSIDERLAAIIVRKAQDENTTIFGWKGDQWIPSDVAVNLDGRVRFLTYISNVSPRAHRGLYEPIEAIATAFVPLFEKLLTDQTEPVHGPIFWDNEGNCVDEEAAAVAIQPKPSSAFSLRGRVVQMAVEIKQMDFNAQTPRYNGDLRRHKDWTKQQQDQRTSDIIATGVYFAVVDNVSLPRIRFMDPGIVDPPRCVDGYADRCLAFSQASYHKMDPCELIDASRPGTVLLVKVHLVDPQRAVISTANVRPNQPEWIVDYTLGDVSRFYQLPTAVHDLIKSMLEWDGLPAEELRPSSDFGPQNPATGFGSRPGSQDSTVALNAASGFGAPSAFGFGPQR